jgi:hypothetical protein
VNSERTQSLLVGALIAVVVVAIAALLFMHETAPPQPQASQRTDLDTSSKEPTGMLHYVAGPDDDFVFRYQAGSCREAGGPMLQLTDDDGWSFHPIQVPQVDDGTGIGASTPTITSVVSLTLEGRHRFALSGTDDKCRIRTYTTADAGQSWQQKPFRANTWYVDPKTGVVHSPQGPANVDCPGIANLTGFDDDSAVVYCTDGTVYQSSDGETWDRSGSSDEVATSVFFESVDDGFAVWPDRACQSRVFRTTNGGSSWSKQGCVYAQVLMPGIGGTDETLMAGGNGGVWVSTDRGESWDRPKNPDDDSDITDRINGTSKDGKPSPSATPSESPSDEATPSDDASDN